MIFKDRVEPSLLKILRYLDVRMELEAKEKSCLFTLDKGFKGECAFDLRLKESPCEGLILNDLLFESNNSVFQIDTLIINPQTIFLIDIKNNEGDYYIDDDKWLTLSGKDTKNLLHQLSRSETLLRKLLQNLGCQAPLESHLVFVNPEFYLYQAPLGKPIVFPAQLNRFLKKISTTTTKLRTGHFKLAEKLVSLHIERNPYERLPNYSFGGLRKGVVCERCRSLVSACDSEILVCKRCEHKEIVVFAVLRSLEEFQILFPERKITTRDIYEWCDGVCSKKIIRKILSEKFRSAGYGRHTYYVHR